MLDAEGRVVLVTGCGKDNGIGAATARLFAHLGASLAVTDRVLSGVVNDGEPGANPGWHGLASLAAELRRDGAQVVAPLGDISDPTDVNRIVGEVQREYGRIDVLVNNAAAPQGRDRGEIHDVPVEACKSVFAVNNLGTFLMCREVIPVMRRANWGRIVNVSSAHGRVGARRRAVYSASKAAILGFSRSLAVDVARYGITVNTVCPGAVLTSRSLSSMRRASVSNVDVWRAEHEQRTPAGRMTQPRDVASAIAFFASDEAGLITAQDLTVDGGSLAF